MTDQQQTAQDDAIRAMKDETDAMLAMYRMVAEYRSSMNVSEIATRTVAATARAKPMFEEEARARQRGGQGGVLLSADLHEANTGKGRARSIRSFASSANSG